MRNFDELIAFIAARETVPHDWQRNDCVRYAAGAIGAQTGSDPLADLKPWTSASQAKRLAVRMGGLEAAVDKRLARIAPAFAARGDIAGVPDEAFGILLMVVEGHSLVGPGEHGNHRLPRSAMTMAWKAEP